ncbi:deoxyribose-phosphate aldolase [Hydrogenivirga sp. 128-5-R1-1]|uniref:deoxyribose-phosphate aldolase n=1 Tax=Hydrogenivirga sp. 128-5-R1-1 TaxID=392423 RepID=UPI00015F2769|nr:deoxyribose-phosphate aldolase [Hydrogenivirga sp. 128-5-R1-1]EDP73190.1 deoxyribose-phosphate aldolase [Hydrogenivirga sp. 128-5-R1-1]
MDLPLDIAKYIEHSNLKPYATKEDIKKLCEEAVKYNFYGVCVNPYYVPYVKQLLTGKDIKIITVVGFPLGANKLKTKLVEATTAQNDGADELDIVWNISAFKSGEYDYIVEELKTIIEYTKPLVHKVIIETAYLRLKEKFKAVELLIEAGADFLKTSTGFASEGAKLEDIRLFKEISQGKLKIKASGGIKDKQTALKMIEFGADRIGTSHGVEIVNEQ